MGIRVGLGYDVVNHRALSGQERLQEGLLVTATAGLFYGARKSATYLKDFKIFGYVSDLCYRVKDGVISFVDKTKQTVVTSASAINKTFANFMEKQFGKCAAREGFIAPLGSGPITVDNMGQFFKETQFGQSIKNSLRKTGKVYQKQMIFTVERDLSFDLPKGSHVYLDALHKNHLEVFDRNGNFRRVLNLDGSINAQKTAKALKQGRSIKDILR